MNPITVSITQQELGCLVYDVPVGNNKAYNQIRQVLRKHALPINLSVYLIPWALKGQVDNLLKAKVTVACDIRFIKFDSSSLPELTKQVETSLRILVQDIMKRINEKVAGIKASTEETKRYAFKYEITKRIEAVETLTIIFGLTQEIQDLITACQALYKLEVDCLA